MEYLRRQPSVHDSHESPVILQAQSKIIIPTPGSSQHISPPADLILLRFEDAKYPYTPPPSRLPNLTAPGYTHHRQYLSPAQVHPATCYLRRRATRPVSGRPLHTAHRAVSCCTAPQYPPIPARPVNLLFQEGCHSRRSLGPSLLRTPLGSRHRPAHDVRLHSSRRVHLNTNVRTTWESPGAQTTCGSIALVNTTRRGPHAVLRAALSLYLDSLWFILRATLKVADPSALNTRCAREEGPSPSISISLLPGSATPFPSGLTFLDVQPNDSKRSTYFSSSISLWRHLASPASRTNHPNLVALIDHLAPSSPTLLTTTHAQHDDDIRTKPATIRTSLREQHVFLLFRPAPALHEPVVRAAA